MIDMKKPYIKPVTESFPMIMEDFAANRPENHSSYIDNGSDDWEGPKAQVKKLIGKLKLDKYYGNYSQKR